MGAILASEREKKKGRGARNIYWTICTTAVFLMTKLHHSFANSIGTLEGQPGFRMVSLRWTYPHQLRTPVTFNIRYCEQHPWGLHRCRYQIVDEITARTGRQDNHVTGREDNFILDIGGLRMSTNYSFQVIPQDRFGAKPSQISLQTKGFFAKATNCRADSSEVSVETGPFFGGRISVEDSKAPGCFVKGNSQRRFNNATELLEPKYGVNDMLTISQTKYTLKISHKECGSVVTESKVTSVIIVQENIPILTHSTRRFVVVCSVSPDSFVVKAGVSLPRETSVAKSIDFNRIAKFSPQTTNTLDSPSSQVNSNPFQGRQPTKDPPDEYPANLVHDTLQPLSHMQSFIDRRESRAMQLLEDPKNGERNNGGSGASLLLMGMMCTVLVASIVAVSWFVRSCKALRLGHNDVRILGDSDTSFPSSSISDDNSTTEGSDDRLSLDDSEDSSPMDFEFAFSECIEENPSPAAELTVTVDGISTQNNSSFA